MITDDQLTKMVHNYGGSDRCNRYCTQGSRCCLSNVGHHELHICSIPDCDCHRSSRYAGERGTLSYKLAHNLPLERVSLESVNSPIGETAEQGETEAQALIDDLNRKYLR